MPKKTSSDQASAPDHLPSLTDFVAATAQNRPPVMVPGRGPVISMADLPLDEETKAEVTPQILAVRDLQGFANAALSARMEQVWGAFASLRTGTDTDNGLIFLYKNTSKTAKGVQVNRAGTQNQVNFSLSIPLAKLKLRPTADRQWNLIAQEVAVTDGPPIFMFNIVERQSVPRNLKAEQAEQAAAEAAGATEQGAEPKAAEEDV